MNTFFSRKIIRATLVAMGLTMAIAGPARAELADLADVPLATSPSDAVLPNLMYIIDDSGSMMWDYMPDNVIDGPGAGGQKRNCKTCSSSVCSTAATLCWASSNGNTSDWGEPPFYSAQFNQGYYNPDINYPAAVGANGLSLGNASATAAQRDYWAFYSGSGSDAIDLTNAYPEIYYCTTNSPTAANLTDTAVCRRNGINNASPGYFLYWKSSTTTDSGLPISDGAGPNPEFRYQIVRYTGHPYYFRISAHEYCSDVNLVNCQLGSSGSFTIPAPIRYCSTTANAADTNAVSDAVGTAIPKCRKKFNTTSYIYPRYGRFIRTDIVAATPTYAKSATAVRPDCPSATSCTYAEELQNFANWYQYYRTRMAMMKTATGRAFLPIDDRYRVGFITINPGSPVRSTANVASDFRYLPIATFNSTQKSDFYDILYDQTDHGSTPLRQALSRVGRHYAGVTTGINSGMPQDPITHSCQQNFALLTSDGYWNDSGTVAIDTSSNNVGNQDNVANTSAPFYVSRPTATLDGVNTTVVTAKTETQQVVCVGTANTNFDNTLPTLSSDTETPCGCSNTGPTRRIKQRVRTYNQTFIDAVFSSNSAPANAYSNITGCVLPATPLPPPAAETTTSGTVTTTPGGSSNTLADVAMYYYKTDLRTGAPLSKSDNTNVPTTDKDIAKLQHMVTFTLGLGLQGLMDYVPDYESDPTSDYSKIKNADTSCAWSTGTCNWPTPSSSSPTTLDDLWHAAVNGRGTFYSAADPNTLADGLAGALSALKVQTAAASASATSSPNITETDNFIYSSTFRTVKWDGEITAQRIDTSNGNILPGIVWSAQAQLDTKVGAAEALTPPGDGRTIWTFDPAGTNKVKSFTWANLTVAEKAYFENKCTALSQCPLLTAAQQTDANNGDNMVNFLRGRTTHEATVYRDRDHVLGDPVNATPAFVKAPRFAFNDAVTPSYADFKLTQSSRQGVLYIAANDGMLHAFNGDTGNEMWAYIPRMVFPDLHGLATDNWDVRHAYSVDGSPQIMDVYDAVAGAWKTLLIAGLGGGGRGYYALDVTNPASPKGVWEVCSDAALCAVSDDDIGYSFGPAVITKRATDGKWIALITSGVNNVTPGTGRGFLYVLDVFTGAILQKVDTGEGDTTTPSGLSKISAFANSFNVDNTATIVYGGDLLGNLWRFAMNTNPPTVLKMAELKDGSGKPQSITTRPELAYVNGYPVVYVGTGRYLGEDDLSDPATLTPALPWAFQQSFYAIKDRNVAHGDIRTASPGLQQQTITILNPDSRSTTTNTVDWATKDGWYVDFNPSNNSPGERVNLDPVLALGTVVVVTNVPSNSACVVGGDAWIYQFDFKDGTYVASATGQQVAQRFTGQTLVGVVVVRLPSGVLKGVATGATGTKTTVGVNIGGTGGAGRRVSWRELIE